jgi:lipid kinase YegS
MSRRHLVLVLHGKAAGRPEVRAAVEAVRNNGHRVDVRVTWEAGDAVRFAKAAAADGVDTVVAGGGDGSLNEVVSGVVDGSGPPRCSLGLLPLGTANDFAHCCGIPIADLTAAMHLAAETEPRPMDLATISGRVVVNLASGGFGTRVTVETPPELKKRLGKISYLLTGATRFNEFGAELGRLRGPNFEWEGPIVALGVGNGRQAGGGVQICPEALLDDGLLDVAVLPDVPREQINEKLAAVVREGLGAVERQVVRARLPWVEIEAPSGMHINLDGEPIHDTHFRFETRKRWLKFHLPAEAPLGG